MRQAESAVMQLLPRNAGRHQKQVRRGMILPGALEEDVVLGTP